MARENIARRLNHFKDDNDENGYRERRTTTTTEYSSTRHSSALARSRPRDTSRGRRLSPPVNPLSILSRSGRPTPLTKTNGAYLFRGMPASGFLLSLLCISPSLSISSLFPSFSPTFLRRSPSGRVFPFSLPLICPPEPSSSSRSRFYFLSSNRMRIYPDT